MAPLLIYVSGPYTADTEHEKQANVNRALDAGIEVHRRGHIPLVPHLTHYFDARTKALGENITWEQYMIWDLAILERCDAILYLDSSPGADIELRFAENNGIIVYRSIHDIPECERYSLEDLE